MASVENIQNGLIEKIRSIKDKDVLVALDKLVALNSFKSKNLELTDEQKAMLEMSKDDIKNGEFISQKAMDQRNLEWLDAM